jgi:hypothetical protein
MNKAKINNNSLCGALLQSCEQQAKRQELLQHFTPAFVENQKNNFLFFCVLEALIAGTPTYIIIQELIEILADVSPAT